MVHLGWRRKNLLGQWKTSYVDSEVMKHINWEIKGCKQLVTVAGINKKIGEKPIVLLFGMNKKDYSSLRKLLRVSVYIMRCIKGHLQWKIHSLLFCRLLITMNIDTLN